MPTDRFAVVVQADARSGHGKSTYHRFIKRLKRRLERHKAKLDPEAPPTYGRYRGWEM